MGPLHRRLFGHGRSSGACTTTGPHTPGRQITYKTPFNRGQPIPRSDRVSETLATTYHHQQHGTCTSLPIPPLTSGDSVGASGKPASG